MTSVNTNASATTALRTLQSTNKSLETTQNRVSTGLKIGEAKDNAAYWAISTTLKSDNKALSTVKDALGLGAATVDTAYQGLNKTLEVLDEIKSKLTASTQGGVDRAKIQAEIGELQKQLTSISSSSVFSGENWLSVNSDVAGFSSQKTVVSSYSRDANNAVSVGTIGIDITAMTLVNASALGEGILDAGKVGNTTTGGLENRVLVSGDAATSGTSSQTAAYVYTAGTAATDTFAATITIDGNAYSVATVTNSAGFDSSSEILGLINTAIGSNGTASLDASGYIQIVSASTGTTSAVTLDVTYGGGSAVGLADTGINNGVAGTSATTTMTGAFGAAITLDSNDVIQFDLAANGLAAKTVTIDRATVDTILGKAANGRIATGGELVSVLTKALSDSGVANVTVDLDGARIRLTSALSGADSKLTVTNFSANKGASILTLDVTTATVPAIAKFIKNVNDAINKVTSAASTLGAVAKRIELQQTFVDTLMDTIDKGIGDLIDADLTEESTRLQALQTKQQLGIQALSIANASTQNVLSLFQ